MVKFSKKVPRKKRDDLRSTATQETVTCASCGALTRLSTDADAEPLCLFCHARMLNEKFHSLKKRSDEDRERLAASK